MSCVTCYVSNFMFHMSHVINFVLRFFLLFSSFFLDKVVKQVGGGSVINGATPPSLVINRIVNKNLSLCY